jgi:hypothetical protein
MEAEEMPTTISVDGRKKESKKDSKREKKSNRREK